MQDDSVLRSSDFMTVTMDLIKWQKGEYFALSDLARAIQRNVTAAAEQHLAAKGVIPDVHIELKIGILALRMSCAPTQPVTPFVLPVLIMQKHTLLALCKPVLMCAGHAMIALGLQHSASGRPQTSGVSTATCLENCGRDMAAPSMGCTCGWNQMALTQRSLAVKR